MKSSNLQKTLKKSEQYLPAEDTFFLADHLEGLSGDSALDIGCGSGYLTDILKSTFRLVVGTDISFNTLVEQNFKTQNVICCNSADALNLDFDVITDWKYPKKLSLQHYHIFLNKENFYLLHHHYLIIWD
jgi:release factor glutamine methyltransferase